MESSKKVSVTKKQNIGSDTGKSSSEYQCIPYSDKEAILTSKEIK